MTQENLNNFLANTQCCLSQKGNTLMNKMRGGQLDKCCMTEHAFSRIVWDVLRCANIGQDSFENSCLTKEQVCDLVAHLNEYCGGCNTYTPQNLLN